MENKKLKAERKWLNKEIKDIRLRRKESRELMRVKQVRVWKIQELLKEEKLSKV